MSWESEVQYRSFNRRMDSLMVQHGFSIVTLAEAAEVSDRQIWSILHGKALPRIDTLNRICRALHTSPEYLYPVNPPKPSTRTLAAVAGA